MRIIFHLNRRGTHYFKHQRIKHVKLKSKQNNEHPPSTVDNILVHKSVDIKTAKN